MSIILNDMSIEMLVGLNVCQEELYQAYRDAITPILKRYGGSFGYDFRVSEVLKAEVNSPINRVFTISFMNKDAMDAFFSNKEYLALKEKYFKNAVTSTTIMATYER